MSSYKYTKVPNNSSVHGGRDPSFWSRVTFGWVCHDIFNKQSDRSLYEVDLGPAASQIKARDVTQTLKSTWYNDVLNALSIGKEPRLWKSLLKVIESSNLWISIVLVTCARLLQPVLFSNLVAELFLGRDGQLLLICLTGAGLWLAISLEAIIGNYYAYSARLIAASIRTGITGLLYDRILTLRESDLAAELSSHLIDKLSMHFQPVESCPSLLPYLVLAPLELLLFSVLLGLLVDWAALTGIAYLLMCTFMRCGVGKVLLKLREHTVFFTAQRLRLFDDVISGIRSIKMNTWEWLFKEFVSKARRKELRILKRKALVLASLLSVRHALPVIGLFISLTTMLMTKCTLNSEIVFTTFMILSIVEYSCMDRLTSAVENLSHMLNMLRRIEEFLLIVPPQQRYSVNSGTPRNDNGRPVTLIQAGSLELAESDTTNPEEDSLPIPPPPSRRHSSISLYDVSCNEITASRHFSGLTNVTFYCRQGEMIAITGRSGSGKTTLLQSIVGELPLVQGQIFANGKIAYVAQKPWIFKGTLRENIVFGESFNESRYAKVMEACALTPDVDDLICGDLTVIGTPGIVLSAGQRARISLARAVYSEAEIYLLDEPLACMGSHIADYIFSNCILGMLSSHVCVLATKREKYLQQASRILLLMNGVIVRDGSYQSLVDSGEDLVWLKSGNDADDDDERERSDMTAYDILEEEMQTEDPLAVRVTPRVYFRYLTAGAHFLILLLLGGTLLLLPGAILIGLGFWFAWISIQVRETQVHVYTVYIAAGSLALLILAMFLRASFFFGVGLRSSRKLHDRFLTVVLKAPVQLLSEKAAQLLKTFSKDLETVDEKISPVIARLLHCISNSCFALLVIMIASPLTVFAVLPSVLIAFYIAIYCIPVAQELRRLEAVALKSVNEHFVQTFLGIADIRSYRKQDFVWDKLYRRVEEK